MTWRTETVGTLCDRFGGEVQTGPFGSQLHASDYQDEGTPVVMPQDLIDGRISTRSIAKVGQSHVLRMPQHVLRRGDIVFSRRGDVARFAIVNEREEGWICGTGCLRIRLNSHEVLSDYLRHFLSLSSTKAWLEHHSRGVTMANTNTSTLRELPLRYPSVDVQRRICSILDKADAIRRKRQEAIALTEQLLRSTFLEMFGDPVTNPKHWPFESLTHLAMIGSGVMKGRDYTGIETVERPYMRVANVQDGYLALDDIKTIELPVSEVEKYTLRHGDILLTEGGDPDKLGRGAVWREQVSSCVHQNHIFRVHPDRTRLTSEYLCALLGSAHGKRYFLKAAKQTTGIATINRTQLSEFPVLLPPLKLQQQYSEFVAAHERLTQRYQHLADEQNTLFNSLVQRAFSGQL